MRASLTYLYCGVLLFGCATRSSQGGSDGGDSPHTPASQTDGSAPGVAGNPGASGQREAGASDPDETDTATLTHCSDEVTDIIEWCEGLSTPPCGEPASDEPACPLPWGCDNFNTAREQATQRCLVSQPGTLVARACGYDVIEERIGAGSPIRAFYDSNNGTLVGTWTEGDYSPGEGQHVGQCSGTIPSDCLGYEYESLSHIEPLCFKQLNPGDACFPAAFPFDPPYDAGALPSSGDWNSEQFTCSTSVEVVSTEGFQCVQRCPLFWGCTDYDEAKASLSQCDSDGGPRGGVALDACDVRMLAASDGHGWGYGYYDDTGALVGAWYRDDADRRDCAGTVPRDCVDLLEGTVEGESLCPAVDAGL